ncbi:MAG: hypothetical protein J6112_03120 [Clostridia bacterium]|nr:hypothetical protein [Clostridia bacterium]
MNTRMDRSRFNIGTYHLKPYARTEQHVKDLADCGIDFVCCAEYDKATLDLFEKYGVGAITVGIVPGWWGGDGENTGTLRKVNSPEKYLAAAAKFKDHPAVWGIDIGDEPSALDFPYYGEVYGMVNSLFPKQFPYLNLYPNYASVSRNTEDETTCQLGTKTYDEHILRYCENVPADYLSYDFYVYCTTVRKAYENLISVADACRRSGRSIWIVLQVNSHVPEKWISENMLRFQAFSAMAFGVEVITWACYTAGWWYNQVLDEKGEKTAQYEKLKKINKEIKTLAPLYMEYRTADTHFVGFGGKNAKEIEGSSSIKVKESLSTGYVRDLRSEDGLGLLVGEMVSKNNDGSRALFITAADDYNDVDHRKRAVTFTVTNSDEKIDCFGLNGKKELLRDGAGYRIELESNEAVIVTVRP